jgi:hypothetical protein
MRLIENFFSRLFQFLFKLSFFPNDYQKLKINPKVTMHFHDSKYSNMLVNGFQKFVNRQTDNEYFFCSTPNFYDDSLLMNRISINTRQALTTPTTSQSRPITKSQHSPSQSSSSWSSFCSTSPTSTNNDSLYESTRNNSSEAKKTLPVRSAAININEYIARAKQSNKSTSKMQHCSFCKNNKESEQVYSSHTLKDISDKIMCPVLRLHVCPVCTQTGDNSHTITYCHKLKMTKRFKVLQEALNRVSM